MTEEEKMCELEKSAELIATVIRGLISARRFEGHTAGLAAILTNVVIDVHVLASLSKELLLETVDKSERWGEKDTRGIN